MQKIALEKKTFFIDPISTELNLSRLDLTTESALDFSFNLQYQITKDVMDFFLTDI